MAMALGIGALSSLSEGIGIALFMPVLTAVANGRIPDGVPSAFHRLFVLSRASVVHIIALIFGLILLKNVLMYANGMLLSWIGGTIGHRLRCRMFSSLMAASYGYWETRDPGKILETLALQTWRVTEGF